MRLLAAITDPSLRALFTDLYAYQDETRANQQLLSKAVAFGRWIGPMAVAVLIFALGRVL